MQVNLTDPKAITVAPRLTGKVRIMIDCTVDVAGGIVSRINLGEFGRYEIGEDARVLFRPKEG